VIPLNCSFFAWKHFGEIARGHERVQAICDWVHNSVRGEMQAVNELHLVEGGDHSLLVTKSYLKGSGETQGLRRQAHLEVIQKFVAKHSETVG
jgi:hypothetical protein